MLFDDLVAEYRAGVQTRSAERDGYSLKRLAPHFSGCDVRHIRRLQVREYINARLRDGVKPATINRELDFFSAAVNYWRFTHEVELQNPVERMSLEEPEGRVRWLTRNEADALIEHCRGPRPHLRSFVRLALHTGCRKNELLRLEWSRVSVDRCYLLLNAENTKSKRRRVVPLNAVALDALDALSGYCRDVAPGARWVFAHPGGRRVTTLRKGFMSALDRAGIEDFRIHDLRHTFASWLVMQGASLYHVRDLLGHSSIEMTERYAHLAPDKLQTAVQLLLDFT